MKDWKYIVYVAVIFGIFALLKLTSPKQYDWKVTFDPEDKNPYGAYGINKLLESSFGKTPVYSYATMYELKDSLESDAGVFMISLGINIDKPDTDALLEFVNNGGSAFLSAQYFWGHLTDTLGLSTRDYIYSIRGIHLPDTASLRFVTTTFDTASRYPYRRDNIHNYFVLPDTLNATVIARNDQGRPVTLRIPHGKGNLILNSTPLAFTNIYALMNENHKFVTNTFSYLPAGKLYWTQYYHRGKREIQTPLRFILTTEPLRWAYYILIFSLLAYMIFEMKRRQRIIPVIKPLENTTLEFVGTIGNLYYQRSDHRNIAEKKILFLLDQIRSRYGVSTTKIDNSFFERLSKKSGTDEKLIRDLFKIIEQVRSSRAITADQLTELNSQIEKCNL